MKRFRSPIQKVQRIQHQQLRIAEMHLAQAQAAIRNAEQQIESLKQQSVEVEESIVQQFANPVTGLPPGVVKSARARLESCRTNIQKQIKRRNQLQSDMLQVQAAYKKLKARSDGVDELMQKKQAEHRQLAMQHEQTELEESARTLRLLNNHEDHCEVEDGVIQ